MSSVTKLEWPFQLRLLAVMIDAGMPIDTSLKSLSLKSTRETAKLQKALRLVKRGVSLPESFRRAALITDFDYAMLSSADAAGRLADGLNHISERRANQLQRAASFKASLILPKALVAVGALAAVVIRIAQGHQSTTEIIISVSVVVGWFYLLTYLSMVLVRADTRIWVSLVWPYSVLRNSSEWYRIAFEYLFYNSLIWQLSAGVPASSAVKNCYSLLKSKRFQGSAISASESMNEGESITNSLLNDDLVLTNRMRQVLLIADQSGKHESAIKHELSIQGITLKQKTDDFFKWLPRVFYVIALVVVSKIMVT